MFDFLKFEGPFAQTIYKIFNMILLSAMWVLFCIPIFTAGASTTALYYAVQKNIKNERGNSWQCYWESFKSNFKQSTLINLIFIAIAFICITDINIMDVLIENKVTSLDLRGLFIVILIIVSIYAFWVFAYIARFSSPVKVTMKTAFKLAIYHLPSTILIAAIGAGTVLLEYLFWPLIFIMPVVSVWFISYLTERIFRMHMSEEDKQLEDDINKNYMKE